MASVSPNSAEFRPISRLKSVFVKPGRRNLHVAGGVFRGIALELDLQHHTQIYCGLYETETFGAIRQGARNCAWAVDVGAGAGELSIYILRLPGHRTIHAFEPQSSEIAIFRRNLAANQFENDSRLIIHASCAGNGAPATHTPIDALNLDLSGKGFLKIDVDGFEVEVLKSAEKTLRDGWGDVLIEVHSEALEAECAHLMSGWGYDVKIIKNAWWRAIIPEKRPILHNRWISCNKQAR